MTPVTTCPYCGDDVDIKHAWYMVSTHYDKHRIFESDEDGEPEATPTHAGTGSKVL